jgi:hypothetical protein
MSDHILFTETEMGEVADDPPPDFGSGTDPATLDCDDGTLQGINTYIRGADSSADSYVTQIHSRLGNIEVFKGETAGYVSQAQTIAADWVTEIQSVNDSFSASIDTILSNELVKCTNTVNTASLVTSALYGVTIETPEDEIALLLTQALVDLNTAKEYLAETISYKNDVDSRVDEVSIAVAFQVSTQEDLVENKKGICEIRKADAILKQDELEAGKVLLLALYEATHGQPYWTAYDPTTGCFGGVAFYQDLDVQWNAATEHSKDAESYING